MLSITIPSVDRYEYVVAQCVELLAWLGWLRSKKLFNIQLGDIEFVPPLRT